MKKSKLITVHTSRTIMSSEILDLINYGGQDYNQSMLDNVFNKKTESSKTKTIRYIKQLYSFDSINERFLLFEDFCTRHKDYITQFAFLYSTSVDYLLSESIDMVMKHYINSPVTIESFEENIQKFHKDRFTPKTLRSVAQNIASSWKQAGYIVGRRKNTRVKNEPTYHTTAFAFAMAYLDGFRGEFMFDHPSVKALDAGKEKIIVLLKTASDYDLLDFSKAGASVVISFDKYLDKFANVQN